MFCKQSTLFHSLEKQKMYIVVDSYVIISKYSINKMEDTNESTDSVYFGNGRRSIDWNLSILAL